MTRNVGEWLARDTAGDDLLVGVGKRRRRLFAGRRQQLRRVPPEHVLREQPRVEVGGHGDARVAQPVARGGDVFAEGFHLVGGKDWTGWTGRMPALTIPPLRPS